MNVKLFLYSRTLAKDYRWILRPSELTSEETRMLEDIFSIFTKYRSYYTKAKIQPLFCINFPQTTVLFTLRNGFHRDENNRDIYSLEGISVNRRYRRAFWNDMPLILQNYGAILDVWSRIEFKNADKIDNQTSKLFSLRELIPNTKTNETPATDDVFKTMDVSEVIIIPFDESGLAKLKEIINSPFFPLSDFAFGCTNTMMLENTDFRVVALVNKQGKLKFPVKGLTKRYKSIKNTGAEIERFNPVMRKTAGSAEKRQSFLDRIKSLIR